MTTTPTWFSKSVRGETNIENIFVVNVTFSIDETPILWWNSGKTFWRQSSKRTVSPVVDRNAKHGECFPFVWLDGFPLGGATFDQLGVKLHKKFSCYFNIVINIFITITKIFVIDIIIKSNQK